MPSCSRLELRSTKIARSARSSMLERFQRAQSRLCSTSLSWNPTRSPNLWTKSSTSTVLRSKDKSRTASRNLSNQANWTTTFRSSRAWKTTMARWVAWKEETWSSPEMAVQVGSARHISLRTARCCGSRTLSETRTDTHTRVNYSIFSILYVIFN